MNTRHASTTAQAVRNALAHVVEPMHDVVSAYLSAPPGSQPRPVAEAERRWRPLIDRLRAEGADQQTLDAIWAPLRSSAAAHQGVAIFARDGRVLYAHRMPAGSVVDGARFAAPANVLPLLGWLQTLVPYVLVMTDRTGADVTAFNDSCHPLSAVRVDGPDDEIERNAPGGWSQPRYQRRAEDSWAHNAAAVAEETTRALQQVDARLVVVGGDVRAVQLLEKELAVPRRRGLVVEHVVGGRHPDGSEDDRPAQVARAVRVFTAVESAGLVNDFTEAHGSAGRAVEGAHDTLTALAERRVATLFVADAHTHTWFAPAPDLVALHPAEICERHQALREGRLDDVAIRAALLTGADIHVVTPGAGLELEDGIGALCRFIT
jgi:hypothetical protein